MEIKIVISESRSDAACSGAHATGGTRGTGESPAASPIVPPPEVLQAVAALGAINAGPAPSVAVLLPTAGPPPFIGASAAETGGMVGAAGAPAAESAGPLRAPPRWWRPRRHRKAVIRKSVSTPTYAAGVSRTSTP